jgi:hypothetical protein
MEPEKPIIAPEPVPTPEVHPLAHTYQDDLARVMNATEAPVVQELLADARARDVENAIEIVEQKERRWYSVTSIILILLTLAVAAFGAYYYIHLTVKVHPAPSVGIFQSTDNVVASSTTIQKVLATYTASTVLPIGKPTLINLVTEPSTDSAPSSTSGQVQSTLLSTSQFYTFIGAEVPEPLQSVISVARLGVVNTGTEVVPFIIASVGDPEKASKEFTIAEPSLLKLFSPALGIDTTAEQNVVGQTFKSQYFYNLPVRTISGVAASDTQHVVFLYGYATNTVVVITAKPEALKAVYDTVIAQH